MKKTQSNTVDYQEVYAKANSYPIGEIVKEQGIHVTDSVGDVDYCDCPRHESISHKSLHINRSQNCWHCWGCGLGGGAIQFVEFLQHGTVTSGVCGPMPDSHREARDWILAKLGLPPLGGTDAVMPIGPAVDNGRVLQCLHLAMETCHQYLLGQHKVRDWFLRKYPLTTETLNAKLIGLCPPSLYGALKNAQYTREEILATGLFYKGEDGNPRGCHFSERLTIAYLKGGKTVYAIARLTPFSSNQTLGKYVKLLKHGPKNPHIATCITNNYLFNEDCLQSRPKEVLITEGVTDCLTLAQWGMPVISPVTTHFKTEDAKRIARVLRGVETVFVVMDNEFSVAGTKGSYETARLLEYTGLNVRVIELPLGNKQRSARADLEVMFNARPDMNSAFAGKTVIQELPELDVLSAEEPGMDFEV